MEHFLLRSQRRKVQKMANSLSNNCTKICRFPIKGDLEVMGLSKRGDLARETTLSKILTSDNVQRRATVVANKFYLTGRRRNQVITCLCIVTTLGCLAPSFFLIWGALGSSFVERKKERVSSCPFMSFLDDLQESNSGTFNNKENSVHRVKFFFILYVFL